MHMASFGHSRVGKLNMECDFETIAPGVHCCRVCGQTIRAAVPASEIRAHCGKQPAVGAEVCHFECTHRGDVVRTESCRQCGAIAITAEVYLCVLHGECTIHSHGLRDTDGQLLRRCISCADITSRPT